MPPEQRLALAYARGRSGTACSDFLALDRRLAAAVAQASEPITGQLRLAWWRDRLSEDPAQWPSGEPLLARLRGWGDAGRSVDLSPLGALVDGWEAWLVAELRDASAMLAVAGKRARWSVVAEIHGMEVPQGIDDAARAWALADMAAHVRSDAEHAAVFEAAEQLDLAASQQQRWPRALRPFAILAALGKRALAERRTMMERPSDMARAMRVGIFGR